MEGSDGASGKSLASQPEVEPGSAGGGIVTSMGTTVPVTSPEPENEYVPVSYSVGVGDVCASVAGSSSSKNGNRNGCCQTAYPACRSVRFTYRMDARYPGVPDARVPPLLLAIRCSTRSCWRMPLTVTPSRICFVLTSSTAIVGPVETVRLVAVKAPTAMAVNASLTRMCTPRARLSL